MTHSIRITRALAERLTSLALALSLCAAPARSAPAAAAPDPARALLGKTAAAYRALGRYDFRGQTHVEIHGEKMNNTIDVQLQYAGDRPRRLRNEVINPNFPTRYIADGDSVWAWLPMIRQYIVWSATEAATMAEIDPNFAQSLNPFRDYEQIGDRVLAARVLGQDTLKLEDRIADVTRLEVEYERDTTRKDVSMWPRVYWIEPATGLVLRDSTRADVTHQQLGQLATAQVVRLARADLNPTFSDTLFRFVLPDGASRGQTPQLPPAMQLRGKPAPDFALPRYGAVAVKGKAPAPVKLSALKGKVVLLDFWATWCGPCRRWMPTVEKVSKSLAGRGLVTYAVNQRETDDKIREYLRQTGVQVPVLVDRSGSVGEAYQAGSIPLTVIVGRDGVVARVLVGLHDEAQLREALKAAGVF